MTTVNTNVSSNKALQENENKNQETCENHSKENEFNNKAVSDIEIQGMVEDDYMDGLDGDALDDEEKDRPRRRSWDRSRGRERKNSRELEKERERDRDSIRNRRRSRSYDKRRSRSNDKKRSRSNERRRSRSNDRRRSRSNDRRRSRTNERRRSRSNDRRRSRSNDKKRSGSSEKKKEAIRRDPSKSNKDIEQDKMKTKKDNDNKMLAEKEKAIKTLLDSDDVVPPGTEGEAIQDLVDKNQQKQDEDGSKRNGRDIRRNSRERRRSPIRNRLGVRRYSPRRSPGRSPIRRRSPITFSPDRRRRSPDDRRRRSLDRETSVERREASRRRLRERLTKDKRSRSRDRRSLDRRRSRSLDRHRRTSRSPFDRHSPRRRRRSLSRSPLRSPSRFRKRSPFLHELARQFQDDSFRQDSKFDTMEPRKVDQIRDIETGGPPYIPPENSAVIHPGGMLLLPEMMTMPNVPARPLGPMEMGCVPMPLNRGYHVIPEPPNPGPSYMNYDGRPPGPSGLNYEPANIGPPPPYYSSDLVMYNQGNPMPPLHVTSQPMRSPTPQPVPAPGQGQAGPMMFPNASVSSMHQPISVPGPKYSPNDVYNSAPSEDLRHRLNREERMKTPEPPIISDAKQSEKTSLSSLLEASVSSKDPSGLNVSAQGFRQEIIRKCERALRRVTSEDPRLKMKGRFFFDPTKKIIIKDKKETASNSILLQKGRTEIHWDEEEDELLASSQPEPRQPIIRKRITHQKICQTDETTRESIAIQVEPLTADFGVQVSVSDLQVDRRGLMDDRRAPIDDRRGPIDDRRAPIEDRRIIEDNRRPLSDRLDWSMRETYDHAANARENDDLRWSLSKVGPARDRPYPGNQWNRGFSPNRQPMVNDHMYRPGLPMENMPRSALEHLMEIRERGIDPRERLIDRDTELRERDMGMRDIRDARGIDMIARERERLMDKRDEIMMGGDLGMRESIMKDSFGRQQQPIDDYNIHNNSFGRGIDRDRGDIPPQRSARESPGVLEDDPEELQIIEERVFDREQTWQAGGGSLLNHFNNIRGAAAGVARGGAAQPNNRAFRGRVAGFRARN